MNNAYRTVKVSFFLGILVCAFCMPCGCDRGTEPASTPTTKPADAGKPIEVGVILPLTGDAATYGSALKKGMDLAAEKINAEGGIQGRPIHLIYEDDANKAQTGVSAFRKLVSADKVPVVIGAMFSAVTLAIAPIAETNQIALLSPTSSAVTITDAGDYVFRIYPSDSYDGAFLAKAAYDRLGARTVSVVTLQAASTTSISQLFTSVFRQKGGKILFAETYLEGATDFRAILTKIKNADQDLVFLPGSIREMALLLRQATELGLKIDFLSISTLYDPKLIELAGNAAEGVIFSSPKFDPSSDAQTMRSFVSAYRAKHNADPDILGAYGYDSVNITALAIRNASRQGRPTGTTIKNALYGITNYPGVTGTMSFDTNGDVTKELQLMKVENGVFRPVTP